ncbi:Lrp/AsnC family transcriptional regulator [Vreelandella aquamarina]|jgi:DNA-binding Lrp family transcriptional regulator|nr:AsnC family transcriptional regulator [Halomonas aquamarina]
MNKPKGPFKMSELDKKDARLATLLQADGRVANARLAEQMHLSEATCWRRHKRLEELGVIEGY